MRGTRKGHGCGLDKNPDGFSKGRILMTACNLCGYVGALVMLTFSFSLSIPSAIIGLALLTVQAIDAKMYNLIGLNVISILGFSYNLIGA